MIPAATAAYGQVPAQERAAVRGRTVEADGTPVAGVSITVQGTRLRVESNDRGGFLIRSIEPGDYQLRAERIGYEPATETLTVRSGDQLQIEVVLTPRAIELRGVTVIGSNRELAEVEQRLERIPGSVALVEPQELRNTRQANFKDVLRFVPGVYVQPRFGAADESQLSIRGSGLRNNFHLRGVNLLVNGMPYRNADGFTDFESLELLTVESMQVYKAANAFRFGGSTLGGAINLQTKTGYTAEPFNVVAERGSFGFLKGQLSSGNVFGDFNYYASYALTLLDGHREHSAQRRDRINLSAGYVISPDIDARAFYLFAHVDEELPGSLTREELHLQPTVANPANVTGRWGRDYMLHHLGIQLRAQLGPQQRLDFAPYFQYRDIVHPIFRVLDQTSRDWGAELRYRNTVPLAGHESQFTLGVQPAIGEVDNRHFENEAGESGALRKDQHETAESFAVYAQELFGLSPRFSAVFGLRYARASREIEDFYLDDGDQSDERVYEAVLPRLGLIYDVPTVNGQVYANATRTHEPPLLLELNSFTVPGFVDLDAQDAWQFELGTRGRAGGMDWDIAVYDIELRDELINANVRPFPGASFTVPTYRNAARTRHAGVEIGLEYAVAESLLTGANGADALAAHVAYTFGRYRYLEDEAFAGNDIPGAPAHVLQAELVYRHPAGLTLRPNVEWVPADYFVDSGNTVKNEGWTALGLRAELVLPALDASIFVEGRNLTDALYSPAVTVDDAARRYFLPAAGRSIYAGVRWQP